MFKARFLASINDIDPGQWDGLFGNPNPFIRHAFMRALEDSGSVAADSGWQPQHLVLNAGDVPVAAMPLYLKSHSWGEYVFDWGWAQAYERHGLEYYPKLVTAIPFTPSRGPRLGIARGQDVVMVVDSLLSAVRHKAQELSLSGWHLLFPDRDTQELFGNTAREDELMHRQDVQFHWFNRDYELFGDYLARLRSSRRKNLL